MTVQKKLTSSADFKKKRLGLLGEETINHYLQERGFSILACNYRTRRGEVDLIAKKRDTIAFIEVKSRNAATYCSSELVTTSKQKKLISAAQHYIAYHNVHNTIIRFDVALVDMSGQAPAITYIENAFYGKQW